MLGNMYYHFLIGLNDMTWLSYMYPDLYGLNKQDMKC